MAKNSRGPAYRIETPRLVVRCSEPADAGVLTRAIRANRDYLAPWLPWAVRPMGQAEQLQRLRRLRADFDSDRDLGYTVLDAASDELVGTVGLHRRGPEHEREIGYWVARDRAGRGYCTEFTAALCRVAFEVEGAHRVQICCDPGNAASNRVPEKLGFEKEGCLRARLAFDDGHFADTTHWGLLSHEFPSSACARAAEAVRAFDVSGVALL